MHYLLHLPHCGTSIPQKYIDSYFLSESELQKNIYEYCDLYTDELFGDMFEKFGGVKSIYSRLLFDAERFGNDEDEDMHKNFKLGWFYENSILKKEPLRDTRYKDELREYFDAHHEELNRKTEQKLQKYGRCTVIDCHSFSNKKYWFLDKSLHFPDICIGFEDYHKDSKLIELIKDEFSEYEIGVNIPYNGSLVPTNYWQKDKRVKSVMIEINKKIYLESDNITKSKNFQKIKQKLNNIAKVLDA